MRPGIAVAPSASITTSLDSIWEADAVQAHPLINSQTLVLGHADLERFLAATGYQPRVIDVPATAPRAGDPA